MILFDTLCIVSILIAVYYCYENGLHNSFTFDDHLAIVRNGDMDLKNPYINLWLNDLWGKNLQAVDSHKSYRPLLTTIFRFLWSKSRDAYYFRLLSVGAHAIVSILVYYLSLYVTKPPLQDNHAEHYRNKLIRRVVAFGGALFFACHTVHVESVTAVVNLAEPLCGIFIIIAYLIYSSSCQLSSLSSPPKISLLIHILMVILWMIIVTIAVYIKETAIVCCLMLLAHIAMLFGKQIITFLFHYKMIGSTKEWIVLWLWGLAAVSLLYGYFTMRSILVHPDRATLLAPPYNNLLSYFQNYLWQMKDQPSYLNASQLIRKAENPFSLLTNPQTRILSFMYLYYRYWELLFFPTIQSPEYTFNCIPTVEEWYDLRNVYSFGSCFLVIFLFIYGILKVILSWIHGDHLPLVVTNEMMNNNADIQAPPLAPVTPQVTFHYKTILYIIFWFVISFFPMSGIVFTLGTLLAERLLYIPSVASCLFLSLLVYRIIEWISLTLFCTTKDKQIINKTDKQILTPEQHKSSTFIYETTTTQTTTDTTQTIVSSYTITIQLFIYLVVIAIALFWFHIPRLRAYNLIWQNDESLFLHTVKVCPTSAKANLQLSKIYSSKLDFVSSWKHVQISKSIDADFCDTGYQEAILAFTKLSRSTAGGSNEQQQEDAIGATPELQEQDEEDWGFDWTRYVNNNQSNSSNKKTNKKKKSSQYETLTPSKWNELTTQEKQIVYDYHFQYIVETLLQNLHCIYSNGQSLELLTKLWSHQLLPYQSLPSVQQVIQQSNSNSNSNSNDNKKNALQAKQFKEQYLQKMNILFQQGKLAYENGIYTFGFQKLIECASISFDLSYYSLALQCIDLAVQSIEQYEIQENHELLLSASASSTAAVPPNHQELNILQCRIYALSGTMRSHVVQQQQQQSSSSSATLLADAKQYLSQKLILKHLLLATSSGKCLTLLFSFPAANATSSTSPIQRQVLEHIKTSNQYLLQYAQQASNTTTTPLLQRDFQEIFFYTNTLTVAYLAELYTKEVRDSYQLQQEQTKTKKKQKKIKQESQQAATATVTAEEEKILFSTRSQLLQLYQYISTFRYKQQDYPLASQYFLYALVYTWSSSSAVEQENDNMLYSLATTVYANPLGTSKKYTSAATTSSSSALRTRQTVQDHIQFWQSYSIILNTSFAQHQLANNNNHNNNHNNKHQRMAVVSQVMNYYRLLYWYTDALVGLSDFYSQLTNVQFVKSLLVNYREGIQYIQQYVPEEYETLVEQLPDVQTIESLIAKFTKTECVMMGTCTPPLTTEEAPSTAFASTKKAKKDESSKKKNMKQSPSQKKKEL